MRLDLRWLGCACAATLVAACFGASTPAGDALDATPSDDATVTGDGPSADGGDRTDGPNPPFDAAADASDATSGDGMPSDAAPGDGPSSVDATSPIDAALACPGMTVDAGVVVRDAAVSHVVTQGSDSGAGSLRAAVAASAPGDVVTFASNVALVQLASAISISVPLTILGPGSSALTIDGGGSSAAFLVAASNVTFAGVTITRAVVGIHVISGAPVVTQALVVTNNVTYGLEASSIGGTVIVRDTGSTFTGNGTGVIAHVLQSTGTAAVTLTGSTITGNQIGIAAVTDTQIAQIELQGCTTIAENTMYGALVEISPSEAGGGFPSIVAPGAGGMGTNLITGNPVGVQRLGGATDSDLTFMPLTQVTGNTTDFVPAYP